jgi:zinc transporter ZupT
VNSGFAGGLDQVAIVALFVVGLLFFVSADRSVLPGDSGTRSAGLAVPTAVAIALGIHGFGEGTAFGATAVATSSTSLLNAFGGLTSGIAYVLHKVLEPAMVGACYVAYSGERARMKKVWTRDILALAAAFVIPSLVGATTGYFTNYDASYYFALGTGASIYAAMRLVRPLFQNMESSSSDSIKLALLLVSGFLSICVAALFHS